MSTSQGRRRLCDFAMNKIKQIIVAAKGFVLSKWKAAKGFTRTLILLFGILLGAGIIVLIIYKIPNKSLQNIILAIAAAIFGGLFTLIGVSWTIRKGDADRRADLIRIESERKEEERKKHIPYIKITSDTVADYTLGFHVPEGLNLGDLNQRGQLNNNVFLSVLIDGFVIRNISSSNIILKGFIFEGEPYVLEHGMLLEKDATCKIETTRNHSIILAKDTQQLSLIVEDILENKYEVGCLFHIMPDHHGGHVRATMEDGEELIGFSHTYKIINAMLPRLI